MKPSPPEQLPRPGAQSRSQLRELQRSALDAIRHPLNSAGRTRRQYSDGRSMREVAAAFIKPNDRLTSFERLEIYNRQYWYRLLDSLWDDFPGLRAIMGNRKFEKLRVDYLNRFPSRSYTMRNLGSRLPDFIRDEPSYTAPRHAMCLDMVRFEWAQIVGFDSEALAPLTVDDLLGQDPAALRVRLQPYLTLLELGYPLDDFVMAVKKRDAALIRGEASNAVEETKDGAEVKVRLPRPMKIYLAVHRLDNDLYYKRLEPQAFAVLQRLQAGDTVAEACEAAVAGGISEADLPRTIQGWFSVWMELGWLCSRSPAAKARPAAQNHRGAKQNKAKRKTRLPA